MAPINVQVSVSTITMCVCNKHIIKLYHWWPYNRVHKNLQTIVMCAFAFVGITREYVMFNKSSSSVSASADTSIPVQLDKWQIILSFFSRYFYLNRFAFWIRSLDAIKWIWCLSVLSLSLMRTVLLNYRHVHCTQIKQQQSVVITQVTN